MYSTNRFTLDLQKSQSQISVAAFRYDTAKKLVIVFTDGGIPFKFEDGIIAVLSGKKEDGSPILHECMIEGNTKVIYEFNSTTASIPGIIDCQIQFYKDGDRVLSAPKFIIVVSERVVNDEDVFNAGDGSFEEQFSVLDNILAKESVRVTEENERVEAEKERVEKENERVEAEKERQKVYVKKADKTEVESKITEVKTQLANKVDKTFVEGQLKPITERQSAIAHRVSELEGLTLTHIEDDSPANEAWTKVAPIDCGTTAFIKRIGGATLRVANFTSKNLIDPKEIAQQFDNTVSGAGEEYFSYALNEDGSITYTTNTAAPELDYPVEDIEITIGIESLPVGVYFANIEGAKDWWFDGSGLLINYGPDWDDSLNDGEGGYVETTRTLKVMLYFGYEADYWDVMDTIHDPQGPVAYEPWIPPTYSLKPQRTSQIVSYGGNIFGGSALKEAIVDKYPTAVVDETNKTITLPKGTYPIPVPPSVKNLDGPVVRFIVKAQGYFTWELNCSPYVDSMCMVINSLNSPVTQMSNLSDGYPIRSVVITSSSSPIVLYYEECGTFVSPYLEDIDMINDISDFRPYSSAPIDTFYVPCSEELGIGINDELCNTLEWTEKYFVRTRRCEDITLDGSDDEVWLENAGTSSGSKYFYLVNDTPLVVKACVCDQYERQDISIANKLIGVNVAGVAGNPYCILVRPENADNMSIEDFKVQLAEKPINMVVALATPETMSDDIEYTPNEIEIRPMSVFRFLDNYGNELESIPNSIAYVVRRRDNNNVDG